MSGFMNKMKQTLDDINNVSITENGAKGYRSTGRALLDLNFSLSSMRNMSEDDIIERYMIAFKEDMCLALKWLFFIRDIRGGAGERRTFRIILKYLMEYQFNEVKHLITSEIVNTYCRWDDVMPLLDVDSTEVKYTVASTVLYQLIEDMNDYRDGKPISLLAKWMPSLGASSSVNRKRAGKLRRMMKLTPNEYKCILKKLRKHLDVVERKMCMNKWNRIKYETVPSRANLVYKDAFMRHDPERRQAYINALSKGEVKINSSVLFPHDIIHSAESAGIMKPLSDDQIDLTDGLWKGLPDLPNGDSRVMVVADGSGSMKRKVGNTNISAWEVATGLAIYFSERLHGEYKNKYITFSENPQYVDFNSCKTLIDKIRVAHLFTEVANTDIYKVFMLILGTAIHHHMKQDELPTSILILSDMEFDNCAIAEYADSTSLVSNLNGGRLFDLIRNKYRNWGYEMPRLVFWNINGRTGTIPMKENNAGVTLVSGFSPNIADMVMSGETDPYKCLVDKLMSDRYNLIRSINDADNSKYK